MHFQTKKPTIEERAAPSHQNLLVLPAVSHTVPAPSPGDYHLSSIPTGLPFLECHTNGRDPRTCGLKKVWAITGNMSQGIASTLHIIWAKWLVFCLLSYARLLMFPAWMGNFSPGDASEWGPVHMMDG